MNHDTVIQQSTACVLSHFSRVRLCDPMDRGLPGASVHGILQARVLEWLATAFSVTEYYTGTKTKKTSALLATAQTFEIQTNQRLKSIQNTWWYCQVFLKQQNELMMLEVILLVILNEG